jgi:hypothetical protein
MHITLIVEKSHHGNKSNQLRKLLHILFYNQQCQTRYLNEKLNYCNIDPLYKNETKNKALLYILLLFLFYLITAGADLK